MAYNSNEDVEDEHSKEIRDTNRIMFVLFLIFVSLLFWFYFDYIEFRDVLKHEAMMTNVIQKNEILEKAYNVERELLRFKDETGDNAFDLLKLTTKNLTDTENYFGVLDIVYSKIEPYYKLRSDLRYEYGVEGTIPAIDRIKVDNEEYLTYIVYDLNKEQCGEINSINERFNNFKAIRFEELGNNTDFICIKNQMEADSYTFYYIIYNEYYLF